MMKNEKGITLVVLVITIIVIIILAGIAIVNLAGNNNMINRAQEAKTASDEGMNIEADRLQEYENAIPGGSGGSSFLLGAIQKALNGDNSDINTIMSSGGEMYTVDYMQTSSGVEGLIWVLYNGEEVYVYIDATGQSTPIDNLSSYARASYAQTVVSDIRVLKGLIGTDISGYVSNDKINIPGFSISNADVYFNSSGDPKCYDIEYYDYLTFDFDVFVDENMRVTGIEQNG